MGSLDVREFVLPDDVPDPRQTLADHDLINTGEWVPPAEADTQEIVFAPPADEEHGVTASDGPLTLVFDMEAEDIDERIAEVCDSAFIYYGLAGLRELQSAFKGTGREVAFGIMLLPAPAKGEPLYLDRERSPNRHRLLAGLDTYTKSLPGRRTQAEAAVEAAAAAAALTRLEASREQVLAESLRYLSLGGDRRASALTFLRRGFTDTVVTGPEAGDLAADLRDIASARRELAGRTARQRAEIDAWEQAKRDVVQTDLERRQLRQGRLSEREVIDAVQAMDLFGDSESVRTARAEVGQQNRLVAELVAQRAARRPVLFRLWDTDVPFEVERALVDLDQTSVDAPAYLDAVRRCTPLRDGIVGALTGTWQAAGQLHGRISDDPTAVWRFRALIDAARDDLYVDESNFAWRAAEQRIADETPGTDLDTLSTWLGRVGLAAAVAGAEPVAAAASVADLIVQGVLLVQKVLTTMEQQLGADAFLEPSDALAVDQTYSGVAVDVFFLALDLWFSTGDVKTLRGLR